jgi:hypothetical protein
MQAYDVGLAAARQVPLFVAPAIPYGNCRSTIEHPGTISISTTTLKGLVKDLVREFYRQGLTRCIIVTGTMGAGKGDVKGYVSVIKPGRILFEIAGVGETEAHEALSLAAAKLPVNTKIVKKA